nr:unnamed protein product [Spirometra erinaceieuropaei]
MKREARKPQLRPVRNADAQPLPTYPRCQRTFSARNGLIGHLRTNCTSHTAPTAVPPPTYSSSSPPPTNSSEPPLTSSSSPSSSPSFFLPSSSSSPSSFSTPSSSSSSPSSSSSCPTAPTTTTLVAVTHTSITHIHDTTTDTLPSVSDTRGEDLDYSCPHCDRTFTSHIGLVGLLRIHRTEAGEPVPGAPSYTHRPRLNCLHCPRTFTHRMGLFGHMRIHESGIDRPPDSHTTPNPIPTSSPFAPITVIATDTDTSDFTCPHCSRTFTFRIDLVSHLRIHRTETGESVPGALIYTHRTCLHCPRTFRHRMGLLGHMHIHDDLR